MGNSCNCWPRAKALSYGASGIDGTGSAIGVGRWGGLGPRGEEESKRKVERYRERRPGALKVVFGC